MKGKILAKLAIFTILGLFLLVPSCFAATVLETTEEYKNNGAFIYGSTRFDPTTIMTPDIVFNAGINESKVWVALGNKLNDLKPVTPYFYDGASWFKVESTKVTPIKDEATIEKIEDNLHIFFVGEEMKTVEVPYTGTVDEGSETEGAVYDKENKQFVVPALSFGFKFTSGGLELEVKTNVDTNTDVTNPEDIEEPKIIDNNIASIGSVIYKDIYAAVEAAKAGETVKLLQDVEITKTIVVTKELKLDLNGKTIENKTEIWNTGTKSWSLISVRAGGKLTIDGNGTLKAMENDCYVIDVQEGGNVTIENGKYVGNVSAVYVYEGIATINGGDYSIQQLSNGFGDYRYTLNLKDNSEATITVKGGTFTGFNPANNLAEGAGTNFLGARCKVVKDGDIYKVLPYDANNVTEEAELRTLMAEGGTVKLGGNIELAEKCIGLTKAVVLDLNGYTISVGENYLSNNVIWTNSTLTVKDSSNGKGTMNTVVKDSQYVIALWAYAGGEITIEKGNYIGLLSEDHTADLIYTSGEGSKVTINGGYFEGDKTFTLNKHDDERKTATIIVKGGTFTGFNPEDNLADTLVGDPHTTNYVAEGYIVKESKNEKNETVYTVVAE